MTHHDDFTAEYEAGQLRGRLAALDQLAKRGAAFAAIAYSIRIDGNELTLQGHPGSMRGSVALFGADPVDIESDRHLEWVADIDGVRVCFVEDVAS